jgi:hypothetical protein
MSTNIYEQAIADAKKLREVAEQNAKNAIIEAITPRVRELIDNELAGNTSEPILESYADIDDDDIVLEESAIMELAREVASTSQKDNRASIFDLLNEIKEEQLKDGEECPECGTIKKGTGPGCEGCESAEKEKKKKESKKDVEESMHHYEQYNQNEDDMNLEELLNEIKMEIDLDIEDEEIEKALLEVIPTIKVMDDEEDEEDSEGEEMNLEDDEEDSEGEAFELPDLPDLKMPEKEDGDEEKKTEESYAINEGLLEFELQRLRKNRSNDSKNVTRTLNESRYQKKILEEKRNNHLLRGKLEEYRGAVEDLRDQLNEMNLFNAKLLYVNKLLQTKGLDSSQKKSIIESIDNAESLREVKLVYKTLSESVSRNTGTLNESKIRKLAGSSSRPTRSGGTLITESSASGQVDRWARLAGLK